MTTTDWIIDIALIAIVFIQLREQRLGVRTILLPLVIMGWAAASYLHGVPTAGNDVLLIAVLTVVGVVLGVLSGLFTQVRYNAGSVYIKATAAAAALWVFGMGARLAFAVWTSHASGGADIGRFSASHDITSSEAWVAALLFMAFGQVIARIAVVVIRGQLRSGHAVTGTR